MYSFHSPLFCSNETGEASVLFTNDASFLAETLTGSIVNSGILNEYMNLRMNSGSFWGSMKGLVNVPSLFKCAK